ncbi:MAG: hypothetical protein KDA24_18175 [Deltaproteobacteria bacterium]|nr:hypothetical protein [Deltaproteobacteria bacterium]
MTLVVPSMAGATGWKVHVLRPPEIPHGGSSLVVPLPRKDQEVFHYWVLEALRDRDRGLRPNEGIGTDDAVLAWPDALPVLEAMPYDLPVPRVPADGAVPTATMEALREATGGGTLLLGTLGFPQVTWSTRTRYEQVSNRDGDTISVPMSCQVRMVRVTFELELVDTSLGRVIREDLAETTTEEQCPSYSRTGQRQVRYLSPQDHQEDVTKRALAVAIAQRVAPHWATLKLHLQRTPKTRRSLDALKQESDRRGATALALAAVEAHEGHGAAHYNAAVFLAVAGHFERADEQLRLAEAIANKGYHADFVESLEQLRAWFLELKSMGIPLEPAPL